ncbi:MAG: class I adenylate cyclase [Oleiphilaceae bacterium]|nr:class I adenylate cyclase [Oleiphilaceae bacterium]
MPLSLQRKISVDYTDGVDRKLLRHIRDRFLGVNQRRLERTYEGLGSRQADLLRILPLLYQVNHPLLPGYVSRDAPRGVSEFAPSKEALSIAAGFSRTFRFKQDRRHKAQIHSLFIMGSTGTLAHSEASDVDAWLCIDDQLTQQEQDVLSEKAKLIDKWANDEGLELHTFVMCASRFKHGVSVPSMDKESSGSAQHVLLLDEFYRTAILLAGRYPLWWLVPPRMEQDYDQTAAMLLEKRFIKETETIDFGGLYDIPKSELVGAGLWQLYKSLESPYKSTLKLMLAEVYARELPDFPTLGVEFKQAIYDDELDLASLDPYYLLYRRLENYLHRQKQENRLDLIRKSFYLKVNKKLSRTVRKVSWQRQFLQEQVSAWGWTKNQLRHLDERHTWRVNEVATERQSLLAELTNAYRFLTNYARANAISSSITQTDMNLLGRKLYAVFQRKAGKIEAINLGISPSMWEENLALHHASSQEFQTDPKAWLLYKELATPADAAFAQPLKKNSSLVELLAWLYFNGIVSRATRLSLVPGESATNIRDVHSVLDCLEQEFPLPLPTPDQSCFETAARIRRIVLLINIDGPAEDEQEQAGQRISDRTDSLSYSSQQANLVKTIDQVVLNSWGEVSAVRYEVGETLLQNLQAYLLLCADQGGGPFELIVRCFSSFRARAIEDRVKALFYEARSVLFGPDHQVRSVRYIIGLGKSFYLIHAANTQFRFELFETQDVLFERLRRVEGSYLPIRFDSHALEHETVLKTALAMNEPDLIQVFYVYQENEIDLYVLDEFGGLLKGSLPRQDESIMQSAVFSFLSIVLDRRQLSMAHHHHGVMPTVALYAVSESQGDIHTRRIKRIDLLEAEPVHAFANYAGDTLHYDFHALGKDFSYTEYGDQQFAALTHSFEHSRTRAGAYLKLTDLSFPADPLGVLRSDGQGFGVLDYFKVFIEFETAFAKAVNSQQRTS